MSKETGFAAIGARRATADPVVALVAEAQEDHTGSDMSDALREGGRVQHGGPVPTADIVREGPEGRTVLVNAAGLCSSCGALEQLDREQRRRPAEDAHCGRRGRS